eukprot:TRINITY_DN41775_c0_g1_i1.p1 TRINITY_DN41775_c0_g1~~TRINITY_DN41775_c0_g1_i1.p1  ORF type:complete len:484 (+),score=108.53 TRINITY_DN41775_c0_g1_i1:44-1495(+)
MVAPEKVEAVNSALWKLHAIRSEPFSWGCRVGCEICEQTLSRQQQSTSTTGLWSQNESLYFDFDELDDLDAAEEGDAEQLTCTSPSQPSAPKTFDGPPVELRVVAAMTGEFLCTLEALPRSFTVRDVKQRLERAEGTEACRQQLLFDQQVPSDIDVLHDLLGENEATQEVRMLRSSPLAADLLDKVLSGELGLEDLDEPARANRTIVLAAVKASQGRALEHASLQLRGDKQVVMIAVSRNGLSLRHATPAMRFDREVVLTAIRECPMALEHAETSLRLEHDIIFTALRSSVRAVECIAEELKCDTSFASEIACAFPAVLPHLPPEIIQSRAMMLRVLQRNGDALRFAIGWHGDPEMALTAIQQAAQAVHHVDPELRKITKFAEAAVAVNPWVFEQLGRGHRSNLELALTAARFKQGLVNFAELSIKGEVMRIIKTELAASSAAPEGYVDGPVWWVPGVNPGLHQPTSNVNKMAQHSLGQGVPL